MATLAFAVSMPLPALPGWAETFGTVSPFLPPAYLSGFGSAQRGEDNGLELAKQLALSDLAMQLNARIRSTVSTNTRDDRHGMSSSLSSRIRVDTDVRLDNAGFEIEEQRGAYYALVYVGVNDLQARETRETRMLLDRISEELDAARDHLQAGRLDSARGSLAHAEALTADVHAARLRWETLEHMGGSGGTREPAALIDRLSQTIGELRSRTETFRPQTLDAAVRHVNGQLPDAGARVVGSRPLAYQDSGFSSRFGARFASLLSTGGAGDASVSRAGSDSIKNVVLSGSDWPRAQLPTAESRWNYGPTGDATGHKRCCWRNPSTSVWTR